MNFPSVTTVLAPFADFSRVSPGVLDAAAERGDEVHRVCALYARGLWVDEVAPECAGYFASFKDWFDAYVERVWLVEERLVCEVLGFTGEPDLVVTLRGDARPSVWDLKTPRAASPAWRAQVSAYRHLARKAGHDIERAGVLRLSPSGNPPILEEYTKTVLQDFNVFLSALNCWRFFHDRD